jgi:hypothetical protein
MIVPLDFRDVILGRWRREGLEGKLSSCTEEELDVLDVVEAVELLRVLAWLMSSMVWGCVIAGRLPLSMVWLRRPWNVEWRSVAVDMLFCWLLETGFEY